MPIAIVIAIAIGHGASAADLPVKAPVQQPPAAFNWSGLYVGVQGGAGWGHARQTDELPFDSGSFSIDGALIGGTLGYNWQSGAAVFGLETDLAYAWIKGTTAGPANDPCGGLAGVVVAPFCTAEIKALGTLRGRIGVSHQNFLPFISGGLAYANLHGSEGGAAGVTAFGSGSKWVVGWTVGAGLEGLIVPNWSLKAEYLYVDLGKHAIFTGTVLGGPVPQSFETTAHIVRVGLNYRFPGFGRQ
jgi:outer membrane immunogenic protein